jgi:hypothetical protein
MSNASFLHPSVLPSATPSADPLASPSASPTSFPSSSTRNATACIQKSGHIVAIVGFRFLDLYVWNYTHTPRFELENDANFRSSSPSAPAVVDDVDDVDPTVCNVF